MKGNIFTTKLKEVLLSEDPEFNDIYLVMNYHPKTLRHLLTSDEYKQLSFSEDHLKTVLYNLLCSMNFLHSANIIHRDIKPANILIDSDCNILICDFGLSRSLKLTNDTEKPEKKHTKRSLTPHVISRWYRAPEVILGERKYTCKADDWSMGCVIAELIGFLDKNRAVKTNKQLFKGTSCYPLSPVFEKDDEENVTVGKNDQMVKILEVMGP
jgi:mitogen-activated protein kinase 1/3